MCVCVCVSVHVCVCVTRGAALILLDNVSDSADRSLNPWTYLHVMTVSVTYRP